MPKVSNSTISHPEWSVIFCVTQKDHRTNIQWWRDSGNTKQQKFARTVAQSTCDSLKSRGGSTTTYKKAIERYAAGLQGDADLRRDQWKVLVGREAHRFSARELKALSPDIGSSKSNITGTKRPHSTTPTETDVKVKSKPAETENEVGSSSKFAVESNQDAGDGDQSHHQEEFKRKDSSVAPSHTTEEDTLEAQLREALGTSRQADFMETESGNNNEETLVTYGFETDSDAVSEAE
jgi:hypothetical protein